MNQDGPRNPNWRGGVSRQHYQYKLVQWQRHPEKMRCRRIFESALRRGKITRQPCEVCGAERVEGHHDDYSQPLQVRWLCRAHHRELHGGMRWNQGHELPRRPTTNTGQLPLWSMD